MLSLGDLSVELSGHQQLGSLRLLLCWFGSWKRQAQDAHELHIPPSRLRGGALRLHRERSLGTVIRICPYVSLLKQMPMLNTHPQQALGFWSVQLWNVLERIESVCGSAWALFAAIFAHVCGSGTSCPRL